MSADNPFDTVKQEVDLERWLSDHMNVVFVPDGGQRKAACCPFHQEDSPSFKIEPSKSGDPYWTWRCYGACSEGGTIVDAVMKAENLSTAFEAVEFLDQTLDLGLTLNSEGYERFRATVAQTREVHERNMAEMNSGSQAAQVTRRYLHGRKLNDETIEHFELSVDVTKGKGTWRLAIPIYDRQRHPVTISKRSLFDTWECSACKGKVAAKDVVKRRHQVARAESKGEPAPFDWKACPLCEAPEKEAKIWWLVHQHPKYLNEREVESGKLLYNESPARVALREPDADGYFLCEGYGDVWAAWQSGHKSVSSYNGATVKEAQAARAAEYALQMDKPIILIPDFDATGRSKVRTNIEMIRANSPSPVDIQVVYGLGTRSDGSTIKDVGELLEEKGEEEVHRILHEARWPADEWLVREVLDTINPATGEPFHSKQRQIELVREVLNNAYSRTGLDHLKDILSDRWGLSEDLARDFVHTEVKGDAGGGVTHMIKSIDDAWAEAIEQAREKFVIRHGFPELDSCMPGGGAKLGHSTLLLGKSGTGKTMYSTQIIGNMMDEDLRVIFLSLEMTASGLFQRMVSQTLGVDNNEGLRLIEEADESLSAVRERFSPDKFYIFDNIVKGSDMQAVTPSRVKQIIQEVNMTRFAEPVQVVIIDHLSLIEADEGVSRSVRDDEMQKAGYNGQVLANIAKEMNVYLIMLQQLPKQVPEGVEFAFDAGRGGSKQTEAVDYVFCIWRPDREAGISDEEREMRRGLTCCKLGKNRWGPTEIANLTMDSKTGRIMPALKIMAPTERVSQDVSDHVRIEDKPLIVAGSVVSVGEPPKVDSPDDPEKEADADGKTPTEVEIQAPVVIGEKREISADEAVILAPSSKEPIHKIDMEDIQVLEAPMSDEEMLGDASSVDDEDVQWFLS